MGKIYFRVSGLGGEVVVHGAQQQRLHLQWLQLAVGLFHLRVVRKKKSKAGMMLVTTFLI